MWQLLTLKHEGKAGRGLLFHSERKNTLGNSNNGYGLGKLDIKMTVHQACDYVLTTSIYDRIHQVST